MILILSDANDASTTKVIEWLQVLNKKWIRINSQDTVNLEFNGNDIAFSTSLDKFSLSEIKAFWYRRGFIKINNHYKTDISPIDNLQQDENIKLLQYIYYRLSKLRHVNSINDINVNKLIATDIARSCGLQTPDDYIFSSKTQAEGILASGNFITKTISGNGIYKFDTFSIYNLTKLIETNSVTASFFPSLVQNYIDKKYEIRTFYFDKKFYSMAIFSQKDKQTIVDFRNYNDTKPNRTVPFKLPIHIEEKLINFMNKIGCNCGSIDLIFTPDNQFVFLEINPVGQFGMVSYPCNYNLEKKIAEYL